MPRFFSKGTEFELLEALYERSRFSRNGEGPGDDAFILRDGKKKWVISSDVSVEKIHFNLQWCSLETALEKAVLSNLSDINAMGGKCSLLFFNLGAAGDWGKSEFQGMRKALKKMETRHGFHIRGGDLVRKENECFFSFTAIGELKGRPLLRSNARPGHRIYVTGELGSSEAGMKALTRTKNLYKKSANLKDPLFKKCVEYYKSCHHQPNVPLSLGPVLSCMKMPVAAIDISDGLSSELWHLSKQSRSKLIVEWKKLPYHPELRMIFQEKIWTHAVLHGGEEFQLLFTGNFSSAQLKRINKVVKTREIGRVETGNGVLIEDMQGRLNPLPAEGWSH
jgi:thiamine-monophosphate kinase